jgi:3-deoxy-D-manno-octulosonic-acid transferase
MLEPLVRSLAGSGKRVLVTFFSPSGMRGWVRYAAPDGVEACLVPPDFNPYVRRFIDRVQPKALLVLQTDLWPTLVSECLRRGVPYGVAFAHVPPGHRWWSLTGILDRLLLRRARFVGLQHASGLAPAQKAGLQALVLGDGRFDAAAARIARGEGPLPGWERFSDLRPVLVVGSSWPEDEAIWLPLLMRRTHWKFVFAPHDPARADELIGRLPVPALRSSAWNTYLDAALEEARVLVVDQIGHLFGLYGGAQAAFVGGGFKQGLHNVIEPLAWGLPVAFGPSLGRHWEAQDALRDGVAEAVASPDQALAWLVRNETTPANASWAERQQGALRALEAQLSLLNQELTS